MNQFNRNAYFRNRTDAANQLLDELKQYRGDDPVVLGIPRGGMPMASLLANELEGELDAIFIKKIGAPGNPELAVGAVGENGHTSLNRDVMNEVGVPSDYIEEKKEEKIKSNQKRAEQYRSIKARVDLTDRTVILVDDGVATGATARACLEVIQGEDHETIVFAVPVAPAESMPPLRNLADETVCLHEVEGFFGGIGAFYEEFTQTTDDEVKEILREFSKSEQTETTT